MSDIKLAIVGGTGFDDFIERGEPLSIRSVYNANGDHFDASYEATSYKGGSVIFVNRHKVPREKFAHLPYTSPSRISYKTLMVGLHQQGVSHVISTSAVGSDHPPETIAIPHTFVDYTDPDTNLDDLGSHYVSMDNPFSSYLRGFLATSTSKHILVVQDGTYVRIISDGRFETPGEVSDIMKRFGPNIYLGMTVPTEAILAKKLDMEYATMCVVTNYAEGLNPNHGNISHEENVSMFSLSIPRVKRILEGFVEELFRV